MSDEDVKRLTRERDEARAEVDDHLAAPRGRAEILAEHCPRLLHQIADSGTHLAGCGYLHGRACDCDWARVCDDVCTLITEREQAREQARERAVTAFELDDEIRSLYDRLQAAHEERDEARAEVERLRRLIDEWLDAHPGIRRMAKGGGDE